MDNQDRRSASCLAVGVLLCLAGLTQPACSSSDSQQIAPQQADAASEVMLEASADADVPDSGEDALPPVVELTVFHTSDEHGWLQPVKDTGRIFGGAANAAATWSKDGLDPSKDLLLSSGDNWAGQAISSYYRGESTVEVFNLMGYQASAIGNHEFDWGQEVLKTRLQGAHFKPLSANIRVAGTGATPDYLQRYVIVPVQGVQVGLVGVTTPGTATATLPAHVADLVFDDIQNTLEGVIPEVRGAGAEVVIVLAHESRTQMYSMATSMTAHADLILAGHAHDSGYGLDYSGGMVASSGAYWSAYSLTTLTYDRTLKKVTDVSTRIKQVSYAEGDPNPVTPDPAIAAVVDGWQAKLDAALGETIGYTTSGIAMPSWAMGNWVCDAWLAAFPEADVAVQNFGGLRQPVPQGVMTRQTIFDVCSFENRIVMVSVTGAQLRDNIKAAVFANAEFGGSYPAVGGMTFSGTGDALTITLKGGAPLDLAKTYKVLINDFMYGGGGGFSFGTQDPNGVDMGVNYRDPVVAWTQQLGTTSSDPLENHIDFSPRNE